MDEDKNKQEKEICGLNEFLTGGKEIPQEEVEAIIECSRLYE